MRQPKRKTRNHWTPAMLLPFLLVISISVQAGETRFEIIGDGIATDISADGFVVVGTGEDSQEAWRWSRESGQVLLGNGNTSGNEGDPGTPDVSHDGLAVSATLDHEESQGGYPGVWKKNPGWTRPESTQRGVVWGMSDNAETLVGLVWQESEPGVFARAASWNPGGGMTILGIPGLNSRANDASQDGSVIVGWSEDLGTGTWQPAAWTGEGTTVLAATRAFCEATAVSPDGSIIVGQSYDEFLNQRGAALWLKSDFGWVQEDLGTLPGTFAGYGQAAALDLSADGRVIVGLNKFDWERSTGFVWTPNGGMQDIRDYLAGQGIDIPADFSIDSVTAVSDDGKLMTGHGRIRTDRHHKSQSFLARTSGEGGSLVEKAPNGRREDPPGPRGSGLWHHQAPHGHVVPD